MLNEARYDKYDGKAIFVVGPPASGKSTFIKKAIDNMNFKLMDSDTIFERLMSKHNISLKMNTLSSKDEEDKEDILHKAYDLNTKRLFGMIKNRLPLIIARTGRNFTSIKSIKNLMEKEGYDCFLVLVNVDKEVADRRNKGRYRTVGDNFFKASHTGYIRNKEAYKKLFPNNIEISTSKDFGEEEFGKFGKVIQKWADRK